MTKWSGRTTSYNHKFNDWEEKLPDGRNAIEKVTFIHAQWSKMPVEVEKEIKDVWVYLELGNDNYFFTTTIGEEEENGNMPLFCEWLRANNIPEDEKLYVHWWW